MAGRNRSALNGSGPPLEFARRLRELRDTSGLTVRQVAARSGYSHGAVSKAESGRAIPSWDLTAAFVRACGQDPELWRMAWEISRVTGPQPATSGADPLTDLDDLGAVGETSATPPPAAGETGSRRHVRTTLPWAILLATAAAVAGVIIWGRADWGKQPLAAAGPAPQTSGNYDVYACVGTDTPRSVKLLKSADSTWNGWIISHPIPWGVPQCEDQIWWTPYLNNGANPKNRFSWIFTTSIVRPSTCSLWAYSPPPPSGHAGHFAHYVLGDGAGPQSRMVGQIRVSQAALKGRWYSLGNYRITTGRITVTLDNSGFDPEAKHGVIAGPIHASCAA